MGLDELLIIKNQMSPLIAKTGEQELPVIETAAACAMLHWFYTEVEKILKIIAINYDERVPSSESWHRDLPTRMAAATETRAPVITIDLVGRLAEFLAFRHLFRGASIALMRWDKLSPLVAKVDGLHQEIVREFTQFQRFSPERPGQTQ